jgi:predicted ATPase
MIHKHTRPSNQEPFLRSLVILRERVPSVDEYPFNIPALRELRQLEFDPGVTIFVGENGSGKSTLIQAIAVAAGFNPEGGSRNFNFATRPSESSLVESIRLVRGVRRPRTGFFLRAESFYNVATEVERLNDDQGLTPVYGGKSLHERSHGESFLALAIHRFFPNGLYVFDEPEAALSPQNCLTLLLRMRELVAGDSQFVVATHSPVLMAYPGATIYTLTALGPRKTPFDDVEHVRLTRDFLARPEAYLRHLTSEDASAT